jgi:histidine triad (HIT) family protein
MEQHKPLDHSLNFNPEGRMVVGVAVGGTSCPFCAIASGALTPEVVAYRDQNTAVFPSLHQQPRNRGHMLVVPVIHVAQIYDVDSVLAGALMTTVAGVARALKKAYAADGVSVRQNNETHGGQDVFHVHFHVVPRFADDGFTTGEARFPLGALEVPLSERVRQAAVLRDAIDLLTWPGPAAKGG